MTCYKSFISRSTCTCLLHIIHMNYDFSKDGSFKQSILISSILKFYWNYNWNYNAQVNAKTGGQVQFCYSDTSVPRVTLLRFFQFLQPDQTGTGHTALICLRNLSIVHTGLEFPGMGERKLSVRRCALSTHMLFDVDDLLQYIFLYLHETAILAVVTVCKKFQQLCRAAFFMRPLVSDLKHFWNSTSTFAWAVDCGCHYRSKPYPDSIEFLVQTVTSEGHLQVLMWLRLHSWVILPHFSICRIAARCGHLHILKWLQPFAPDCVWDWRVCKEAAKGGHLSMLMWLRSLDPPCPWDENTCAAAAAGGHLEVLQWLRSQRPPCPWNDLTFVATFDSGSACLQKWLLSQSPPCPKRALSSRGMLLLMAAGVECKTVVNS